MRWILRILGLIAALVALAAIGLYLFFDVNRYRGRIQTELEKNLRRPVQLGALRLKLLPPAIAVENLSIGEDPAFPTGRPFLTARELSVRSNLGALVRGEMQIDSLLIADPSVALVRKADGSGIWNVASIGPAPEGQSAKPDSEPPPPLALSQFAIVNGHLSVNGVEYRDINLTLHDLGFPGRPSRLTGSVRFSPKAVLELSAEANLDRKAELLQLTALQAKLGGLAIVGKGSLGTGGNQAIDLRFEAREASIAEVAEAAAAIGAGFLPGTRVAGTAAASIGIRGTQEKAEITGSLRASRLEVKRDEWKLPVRVPEIHVALTPGLVKSNRFQAQCGNTQMAAAFSVTNPGAADAFLAATLTAADARLEELLHIAGAFGVKSAAAMSGAGDVALDARIMGRLAAGSAMAYSGSGRLRNATINLPDLSRPIAVRQADLRFEKENAILDNVVLAVAGSTLQGSLSVKRFSAPDLRFKAEIDQIDAAELRGLTKPAPASPKPAAAGAPSALTLLTGGGTLRIGRILYDNLTLNEVRAEASLDRGTLRLDPLSAELYGGRHSGNITVDLRTEATRVSLDSKIERVEANSLISSMTSLKKLIYGLVGGEAELSFVSKPGAAAAGNIASTLNGTFRLRLTDGKLTGFNLINQLAQFATALGVVRQAEPVTGVAKMSATLKIKDGVASTNDLRMDFAGGSLAAQGIIGLADQSIRLKVIPVLSRQTSEQFGAGKAAGILSTALVNQNGELVIPVVVSGTVAAPRFLPDAEMMAKMKLEGLVPALSNPAALGSTVKGAIEAGKRGSVTGVIDAITGRRQPQPPPAAAGSEPAPPELGPPAPPQEKPDLTRKTTESLIDLLKRRREKK